MMSPHVQVDYNWAYFSDDRKRRDRKLLARHYSSVWEVKGEAMKRNAEMRTIEFYRAVIFFLIDLVTGVMLAVE